jgi:hypothetical protein
MHILTGEGFISLEIPLYLLVFRSGVEKGGIKIFGIARETFIEPFLIVCPDLGKTLRPRQVVGTEPYRIRGVVQGGYGVLGISNIRKRDG